MTKRKECSNRWTKDQIEQLIGAYGGNLPSIAHLSAKINKSKSAIWSKGYILGLSSQDGKYKKRLNIAKEQFRKSLIRQGLV